ncbi:uncharacterized protein [Amphiura filiformis]|uniref:uncharacterized protein n=1 Tax=Amphiura filiformis TaxID=82378 RepID=UPI003B21B563
MTKIETRTFNFICKIEAIQVVKESNATPITVDCDKILKFRPIKVYSKERKPPIDSSPEVFWEELKTTIQQSAEEVLGYTSKKNRVWFDEIQTLMAKKRSALRAHLAQPLCPEKKSAFRTACSILREIQNKCWTDLAQKTQLCADTGDYVPTACYTDTALNRIPQQPIKQLDEVPTLQETCKAIEQLKTGKAGVVDGIPAQIWKHGGPILHIKLHELFYCCWNQGKLPKDLRDAVIITLYKNKGQKSDCSNYRRITLLSISGKVLARILLNRLVTTIAEEHR